ncbi:MAG: hypothetical protein RLZZ573_1630 [Pseudomonadota bacterium]
MNFEQAGEKYIALRNEVAAIEAEAKTAVAEKKATMLDLENWFTLRAQEEGMVKIPTSVGTAYWSTHNAATVADRNALFEFCKENNTWDLIESRASKTAVKSYVEGHGVPPPGVNFSSVQVFNFRKTTSKE